MTEPSPPPDPQPAPTRRRWRMPPASAVLAGALLMALTGVAAGLAVSEPASSAASEPAGSVSQQQAALAAARAEGAALTTLSWRSPDADLNRILAGAVPKGQLYSQFAAQRSKLPELLRQNHSVSRGTVLASALSSLTGETAKALVAVDATISGSSGAATVKHYRMMFTMQRTASRWLAADVSFVGAPQ